MAVSMALAYQCNMRVRSLPIGYLCKSSGLVRQDKLSAIAAPDGSSPKGKSTRVRCAIPLFGKASSPDLSVRVCS